MIGERCAVTDLVATWHAHCTCPSAPTPPDPFGEPAEGREKRATVFRSAYDGECSKCDDPFAASELIRSDGEGGWIAEQCCGDGE